MENHNGHTPPKPAVSLVWDQATGQVDAARDPEQVKSWEQALGLLHMAIEKVQFQIELGRAQAMQKRAMEQAQTQALHQKILRSGIH